MQTAEQNQVSRPLAVSEAAPRDRRVEAVFSALVLLAYFAVVLLCQHQSHATAIGFGSYPDECSHYITGLMMHDYLRAPGGQSPVAFARQFYLHIPLIGIGHWPPLFYLLQGGWMLVAGTSRRSDLVLIAMIAALLAFEVYRLSRPYAGRWGALLVGIWLLSVPVMRWSDDLVMVDVFAALTILWATVQFGRFLETERAWDSVWFGVLAGIAFLVKPAALCLAFVPILAIVLTGKYRLLRKPALWCGLPAVAILVVPWYAYTLPLAMYGHNTLKFGQQLAANFPLFFRQLWHECSFLGILGLVGVGIWVTRRRIRLTGVEAGLAVLPVAVFLSLVVAHVDLEPRYLLPAIAPLLVAASLALTSLLIHVEAPVRRKGLIGLVGLLVCTAAFAGMSHMPKLLDNASGVEDLASRALAAAPPAGTTMLVVAPTAAREGRIMAELAARSDQRERNVVVRATKLLADVDWNATSYTAQVQTPEQLMQLLDQSGIDLILIDVTGQIPSAWSHYDLAVRLPEVYPSRFQQIGAFPNAVAPVYRLYRVLPGLHPVPRPDLMLQKLNEKFEAGGK